MSKTDLYGSGCTLLVGCIAYFIGGPIAATLAGLVGIVLIVLARARKEEEKPEPSINDALKLSPVVKRQVPSDKLDLGLIPSSGPSDKMLLAIKNNGSTAKLNATCRVVDRRNDPNIPLKKIYDLPWEGHKARHSTIVRGESRNLLIATADVDYKKEIETVMLIERLEGGEKHTVESSTWPRYSNALPEYDLEVSVFGESDREPLKTTFTLKCGGRVSALEMVRTQQISNQRQKQTSTAIQIEGCTDVMLEGNRIEGFDKGINVVNSQDVKGNDNTIIGPKKP